MKSPSVYFRCRYHYRRHRHLLSHQHNHFHLHLSSLRLRSFCGGVYFGASFRFSIGCMALHFLTSFGRSFFVRLLLFTLFRFLEILSSTLFRFNWQPYYSRLKHSADTKRIQVTFHSNEYRMSYRWRTRSHLVNLFGGFWNGGLFVSFVN